MTEEIEEQIDGDDSHSDYQFLYTFVMEVDVVVDRPSDGTQVRSLERLNFVVPDTGLNATDTQNAAIGDGVKQALATVFTEYDLYSTSE